MFREKVATEVVCFPGKMKLPAHIKAYIIGGR